MLTAHLCSSDCLADAAADARGDGPSALRFARQVLRSVRQMHDRGAEADHIGLGLLVKRAAIDAGVPGAQTLATLRRESVGDPRATRRVGAAIDQAQAAITDALRSVEAVWTHTGYPECGPALRLLSEAESTLLRPDRISSTPPAASPREATRSEPTTSPPLEQQTPRPAPPRRRKQR